MPFADDFAQILQNAGIAIEAASVPSQDEVQAGLDGLAAWLNSLDDASREAADGVTAQFQVKAGLADPEVNIAQGLSAILLAADNAPATLTITQVLEISQNAFDQAAEAQV